MEEAASGHTGASTSSGSNLHEFSSPHSPTLSALRKVAKLKGQFIQFTTKTHIFSLPSCGIYPCRRLGFNISRFWDLALWDFCFLLRTMRNENCIVVHKSQRYSSYEEMWQCVLWIIRSVKDAACEEIMFLSFCTLSMLWAVQTILRSPPLCWGEGRNLRENKQQQNICWSRWVNAFLSSFETLSCYLTSSVIIVPAVDKVSIQNIFTLFSSLTTTNLLLLLHKTWFKPSGCTAPPHTQYNLQHIHSLQHHELPCTWPLRPQLRASHALTIASSTERPPRPTLSTSTSLLSGGGGGIAALVNTLTRTDACMWSCDHVYASKCGKTAKGMNV